jgi:hypothetical protein
VTVGSVTCGGDGSVGSAGVVVVSGVSVSEGEARGSLTVGAAAGPGGVGALGG